MIVSRRPEGLLVVRQVDHQDQCRLMARAWGAGGFEPLDRWDAVEQAAAWHDEGWRSWERWPEIDDRGRPTDFADLDRAAHVRLYSEGIRAAARRSDEIGLLVSMHGQGLYEKRLGLDGPPPPRAGRPVGIAAFLAGQDRLQSEVRARLGGGEGLASWAWAAYRLLQAWDLLSLYLIWRALPAGRTGALPAVPRDAGDDGIAIALTPSGLRRARMDPYPFAVDPLELPVRARLIEDRLYRSHADLRRALDDAPWRTEAVSVEAGAPRARD